MAPGLRRAAKGWRAFAAGEISNQLQGRAGQRQLPIPSIDLTHNLGGVPYLGVAAVAILGLSR
jgi:acetyl-CoA C-acetyltransferase